MEDMEDKELLELAAKAAGIEGDWSKTIGGWDCLITKPGSLNPWQPLHDDGDALRLAARLEIDIEFHVNVEAIAWGRRENGEQRHVYQEPGLSMAATRRAIVRAAASMAEVTPNV